MIYTASVSLKNYVLITRSELRKVLFGAVCEFFLFLFVCHWNISATAERICVNKRCVSSLARTGALQSDGTLRWHVQSDSTNRHDVWMNNPMAPKHHVLDRGVQILRGMDSFGSSSFPLPAHCSAYAASDIMQQQTDPFHRCRGWWESTVMRTFEGLHAVYAC